jgi:hypothetical protein
MHLRQHVPSRRLQHRSHAATHLRLQTFHEDLGRIDHGRKLHQSDTSVHGDCCHEYGHGRLTFNPTDSNGPASTDAEIAKSRVVLCIWCWLSVSAKTD